MRHTDTTTARDVALLGWASGMGIFGALLLARTGWPGIPCPSKLLFHLPCPGCGLTRSWIALLRGDALTSFRYHPLGLPLMAFGAALFVSQLGARIYGVPADRLWTFNLLRSPAFMKAVAAVFLLVWAVRMYLSYVGNPFFLW